MKKRILATLLTGVMALSMLAGCGSSAEETAAESADAQATAEATDEDKTITVGASITPHAEILNDVVKGLLEEEGWTLEVVEYNDYVLPNTALEDGDLDANFFQHYPYLENFNEENGTHIVSAAAVHFEPMAIYAGKTASLDELADGAIVAVPNDTTNEARALLLLEAQGLITLDEEAGVTATVLDIVDNPLNLQIQELEAAQIPQAIGDVDIAVINGNYAVEAGLTEFIAQEASDSLAAETYANIIAVREGEENSEKIQALVNAVLSDEVRDYINNTYEGAVVPVF
ncbi:MAG: MetQ/NlpA family ABC transporter substrate-binding protein [Eubacterium sp.]|nr:MetQ/NlpA family ABC transporter substrate-binding protein [Eubacterium sp.]